MKKLIAILFASHYLLFAIGVNLQLHYCGGKLDSISIFKSVSDADCCGGKAMKKDCCNDDFKLFKIKEAGIKKISSLILLPDIQPVNEIFNSFSFRFTEEINFSPEGVSHSPPSTLKIPIHIRNQVFLI